eukprot:CAMPEP_0119335092 /NCGR_PEP_ID=MMETSP1333-20130426/88690_1 /TAXON_ID=418940 /ORGANISM="Scyphosphaera apsteinii, Strain RCC1455" /LENGTH=33 /DNA_ID= /DNA_START= /DNA_END= /DNA_ORIENTATION=
MSSASGERANSIENVEKVDAKGVHCARDEVLDE